MFQFLAKWFKGNRPVPIERSEDPVLGALVLNPDGDWWEAKVEIGGKMIEFSIGGDVRPAESLLAHAREIAKSYTDFESVVASFLAEQVRPRLRHIDDSEAMVAKVIKELVIERVCLFSPDHPNCGMIYFRGPDEFMLWKCDYVDGKPKDLCADT